MNAPAKMRPTRVKTEFGAACAEVINVTSMHPGPRREALRAQAEALLHSRYPEFGDENKPAQWEDFADYFDGESYLNVLVDKGKVIGLMAGSLFPSTHASITYRVPVAKNPELSQRLADDTLKMFAKRKIEHIGGEIVTPGQETHPKRDKEDRDFIAALGGHIAPISYGQPKSRKNEPAITNLSAFSIFTNPNTDDARKSTLALSYHKKSVGIYDPDGKVPYNAKNLSAYEDVLDGYKWPKPSTSSPKPQEP